MARDTPTSPLIATQIFVSQSLILPQRQQRNLSHRKQIPPAPFPCAYLATARRSTNSVSSGPPPQAEVGLSSSTVAERLTSSSLPAQNYSAKSLQSDAQLGCRDSEHLQQLEVPNEEMVRFSQGLVLEAQGKWEEMRRFCYLVEVE